MNFEMSLDMIPTVNSLTVRRAGCYFHNIGLQSVFELNLC